MDKVNTVVIPEIIAVMNQFPAKMKTSDCALKFCVTDVKVYMTQRLVTPKVKSAFSLSRYLFAVLQ